MTSEATPIVKPTVNAKETLDAIDQPFNAFAGISWTNRNASAEQTATIVTQIGNKGGRVEIAIAIHEEQVSLALNSLYIENEGGWCTGCANRDTPI
jgi:hypothetical protein